MARDFRAELSHDRCWDAQTEAIFQARGEAIDDAILQNREELIGLCEFIEAHQIRSYLEIGAWTGRLACTLHRLFRFDRVAVCDDGYSATFGLPFHLPDGAHFLQARSESAAFLEWRAQLGAIDLVFIDANHAYHAVKRDVETNRVYPHRFLALHDITGANRHTLGVRRFWQELEARPPLEAGQPLEGGERIEIVRPHLELGLDHSIMGIGIWCSGQSGLR